MSTVKALWSVLHHRALLLVLVALAAIALTG